MVKTSKKEHVFTVGAIHSVFTTGGNLSGDNHALVDMFVVMCEVGQAKQQNNSPKCVTR